MKMYSFKGYWGDKDVLIGIIAENQNQASELLDDRLSDMRGGKGKTHRDFICIGFTPIPVGMFLYMESPAKGSFVAENVVHLGKECVRVAVS